MTPPHEKAIEAIVLVLVSMQQANVCMTARHIVMKRTVLIATLAECRSECRVPTLDVGCRSRPILLKNSFDRSKGPDQQDNVPRKCHSGNNVCQLAVPSRMITLILGVRPFSWQGRF
jgi:hypothetical protein